MPSQHGMARPVPKKARLVSSYREREMRKWEMEKCERELGTRLGWYLLESCQVLGVHVLSESRKPRPDPHTLQGLPEVLSEDKPAEGARSG